MRQAKKVLLNKKTELPANYFIVDKILKHKWTHGWTFLTTWEGFPISSATWEPLKHFRTQGDKWNEILLEYLEKKDLKHILTKTRGKKHKEPSASQEQASKVSSNDTMNVLSNVEVVSLTHPHIEEEVAITRQCVKETPRSASSLSLAFMGSECPKEESVGGALGTTPSRFLPTPFSLFAHHEMFPSIQHHVEHAIATPSSGGANASFSQGPSPIEGPSPLPCGAATGGGHLVPSTSTHKSKAPFM